MFLETSEHTKRCSDWWLHWEVFKLVKSQRNISLSLTKPGYLHGTNSTFLHALFFFFLPTDQSQLTLHQNKYWFSVCLANIYPAQSWHAEWFLIFWVVLICSFLCVGFDCLSSVRDMVFFYHQLSHHLMTANMKFYSSHCMQQQFLFYVGFKVKTSNKDIVTLDMIPLMCKKEIYATRW